MGKGTGVLIIIKTKNIMEKYCQSCGIPMNKDPECGGTNIDGSKNKKYCSYCFRNGQFVQPDLSVEEMQSFCMEKMDELGIPPFKGWLFARSLPRLERWRDAS